MAQIIVNNQLVEVRACSFAPSLSQLAENRYTYVASAIIGSPTQQMVANQFNLLAGPLYQAWFPDNVEYSGCIVRTLNNPVYAGFPLRDVFPGAGGPQLWAPQAAAIITKRTDFPGPSGRGRVYIPWVDAGNVLLTGELDPTATAILDTIAQGLMPDPSTPLVLTNGVDSVTLTAVLVQKPYGPATTKIVTRTQSQTKLGTQRSRSDYGALNPLTP